MKYLWLTTFILGCGETREIIKEIPVEKRVPVPVPQDPIEPPAPPITSFAQAEAVVLLPYCSECHADDPFLQDEAALKDSRALNLVGSRSMPPPNASYELGTNLRQVFLTFLSRPVEETCEQTLHSDDC